MRRSPVFFLAIALLSAAGTQASVAQKSKSKSTNAHSDFLWAPRSSGSATYNPKEIKISNPVPWQKSKGAAKGGTTMSPWTTTHGSGGSKN